MQITASIFDGATGVEPREYEMELDEFFDSFMEEPELVEGVTLENAKAIKNQGRAWGGRFNGPRSKKNFLEAYALVYDLDGLDGRKDGVDLQAVRMLLNDMNVGYAVHSTFSSGYVAPLHKLRVVLPLSRPVSADEYIQLWDTYAGAFMADKATRNPERLNFAPRIPIEHKDHYFREVVRDRPLLQPPAREVRRDLNDPTIGGPRDWLAELRTCENKNDTLIRAAFKLGKTQTFEEVWPQVRAALESNTVSAPVQDWAAAEDTCRRGCANGARAAAEENILPETDVKVSARAQKALERYRKQLKSAPNLKQLNRVGFYMGEHIAAGAIDAETVRTVLLKAVGDELEQADAQSALETAMSAGTKKKPESWKNGLTIDDQGKYAASDKNCTYLLENHPECKELLFTDTRTDTYMLNNAPPWECPSSEFPCALDVDGDAVAVMHWLSGVLGSDVSLRMTKEALVHVAAQRMVDPFRDYLEGLSWDGTARLGTWLVNAAGAEAGAYTDAVGTRWLIGGVARAMNPGCKMDTVLVLTGGQGIGKSTTFATLVPVHTWFTDSLPGMDDKDSAIALYQKVVVEMAELSHMRKVDVEKVKHFVASSGATVRPAYARVAKYFPRRGILGASTNASSDFLEDPTGARRFWIVAASVCNPEWLKTHRDQLWAEAVELYRRGEQWWLTPEEEGPAREFQDIATRQDPLVDRLADYADNGFPSEYVGKNTLDTTGGYIEAFSGQFLPGNKPKFLTVEQVCTVFGLETARSSKYAAALLTMAGFKRGKRERIDGRRVQPYVR